MKSLMLLAVFFLSQTGLAQSMQPGLWRAKSTLVLNNLPLPASEDEECVSKSQAKDVKQTITKELSKKGCTIQKWNLKSQQLDATLNCKSKDLEAKGTLKGKVENKSYKLTGEAEGTYKMIPSFASLQLEGQWVKNCTK